MLQVNKIDFNMIIKKAGLKPGMVVGDFGCGAGFFSKMLAKNVSNLGTIYAVDVMKDVLKSFQRLCNLEGLHNIKTIWSDLEVYGGANIQDLSLDVGFIINTFCQSKKESNILKEVVRMVKINGRIIIVDWHDKAESCVAPSNSLRTGVEKIRKICEHFDNLEEIEIFEPGKNHYGIIFKKIK